MATIIDSLVVEILLDTKKLIEGQNKALSSMKKTGDESVKQAKNFEHSAERITQYIGKMRNYAVGFTAAAFGASGIIDFIKQVTTSNAALSRSAPILGTTVEKLSVWRSAVKLAGGTAEGLQQTVAGLVSSFARFGITGVLPESTKYFEALRISVVDANGKLKTFDKLFMELSEKTSKMDPVFGAEFLRGAGTEESMIPFLLKGPAAMREYLDTVEKTAKVTKEAADKSAELERKWVELSEAAKGIGINIVEFFTPAMQKTIEVFGKYWSGIGENLNKIKENEKKRALGEPVAEAKRTYDPSLPDPVGTGGSGEALRQKRGAGSKSLAVYALASSLQNSIPGLKEFTAFDDTFHKSRKSKHNEGLALDFTVNDESKYAETTAAVQRHLDTLGIVNAYIRNEKDNPSPGSSGPHIHVGFANKEDAAKFTASMGASGAAAIANAGASSGGRSSETNIGEINITVPGGDAAEISRNIDQQIKRRGDALNAQSGAQ